MKGLRCAGGCGDRERECAVGGRAGRAVGVPCAKAPLRRRNAAAGVRLGGRIVSKQPVAVDETAVTGCAFATRQRLWWSRRMWRAGSDRCNRTSLVVDRRSERKPEDAEGSTAVKTSRAARPACELTSCREANLNRRETAAGAGTMGAHRAHPFDGMGARRREQKEKSGEKKSNGRWAAQHCASNHRVSDRGLIGKKGCFRGGNEKAKLRQRGNGAGGGHEMADAAIVVLVAGHLPRQMVVPMAWAVRSVREGGRGRAVFARVLPIAGGGAQAGDALGALSVDVEADVLRWHRAVMVVKGFHHQLRQQGEEKNPSQGHLTTEGAKFCGHVSAQR